jgi:hypothetical protein
MSKSTQKLASLTAVGVGALTLTSGSAKASITVVDVDTTYSFTANSNPTSFHAISHRFSFSSLAPHFSVILYSAVHGVNTFNRFANLYGAGKSTQFVNFLDPRIAAGKTWNQVVTTQGTFARLADRSWGGNSTLSGQPAGNNLYELFRFSNDRGTSLNYGWVEYNVIVTMANSSLAADGPNITIDRYAWNTTANTTIAAGDIGATPEPATFPESALGALVLGAEGLRRWRKSRKQA